MPIFSTNKCPTCSQTVKINDIRKLYLNSDVTSSDNNKEVFLKEILAIRDLQEENGKMKEDLKDIWLKLNELTLNFCKVDTENINLKKEIESLKKDMEEMDTTMKIKFLSLS